MDYESFLLPEENNGGFPGHVTEDSLGVSQLAIDVDTALEAVEGKLLLTSCVVSSVLLFSRQKFYLFLTVVPNHVLYGVLLISKRKLLFPAH